jgi:hypothetical protein
MRKQPFLSYREALTLLTAVTFAVVIGLYGWDSKRKRERTLSPPIESIYNDINLLERDIFYLYNRIDSIEDVELRERALMRLDEVRAY